MTIFMSCLIDVLMETSLSERPYKTSRVRFSWYVDMNIKVANENSFYWSHADFIEEAIKFVEKLRNLKTIFC